MHGMKVGGKEEAHGGHLMWVITILPVWDCCPAVLLCVCISHTCCIGLVSGAVCGWVSAMCIL